MRIVGALQALFLNAKAAVLFERQDACLVWCFCELGGSALPSKGRNLCHPCGVFMWQIYDCFIFGIWGLGRHFGKLEKNEGAEYIEKR